MNGGRNSRGAGAHTKVGGFGGFVSTTVTGALKSNKDTNMPFQILQAVRGYFMIGSSDGNAFSIL